MTIETQNAHISTRVTPSEKENFLQEAEKNGKRPSDFLREIIKSRLQKPADLYESTYSQADDSCLPLLGKVKEHLFYLGFNQGSHDLDVTPMFERCFGEPYVVENLEYYKIGEEAGEVRAFRWRTSDMLWRVTATKNPTFLLSLLNSELEKLVQTLNSEMARKRADGLAYRDAMKKEGIR